MKDGPRNPPRSILWTRLRAAIRCVRSFLKYYFCFCVLNSFTMRTLSIFRLGGFSYIAIYTYILLLVTHTFVFTIAYVVTTHTYLHAWLVNLVNNHMLAYTFVTIQPSKIFKNSKTLHQCSCVYCNIM